MQQGRSSQAVGVSSQTKESDSKIALKVLQGTFTAEKLWLFNKRLQERWDIKTDELFNTWKLLKTGSDGNNIDSSSNTTTTTTNNNNNNNNNNDNTEDGSESNGRQISSNPFDQHLRYPTRSSNLTEKKQREALPHAISGRAFLKYLNYNKQEKERVERKKEENKRKREASRAQKTEKSKRKKVQPPPQEHLSDEDEYDNDEEEEEINPNKCPKCSRMYDSDENQWVGCETCDRWFHKSCTDIEGANKMSNSELNELEWLCEYCTEE
ncbi:hypothetical protein HOLleu_01712 [Holothuria leucospilota]|uniref:PHD-type domain-containing protein n=1 Tax=Holothuria leucospilota TaxID=206669 RepID=A0A9Q1CQA8_HOLLE|nr:hypothetical protein HOLleu_01712 [Holothuria leucospilota]